MIIFNINNEICYGQFMWYSLIWVGFALYKKNWHIIYLIYKL